MNALGQLELSTSMSKKYNLIHKKTVLGVNKIYRLFLGKDYISFQVNYLIAGASVKEKHVTSWSSLSLEKYLVFKAKNGIEFSK